jgi:N-glycosylase/DNA lyase
MIHINGEYFDLNKIADSGQCFRWRELEPNRYEVPAFDTVLTLSQSGGTVTLDCSQAEYDELWHGYFDMDSDYSAYHLAAAESGFDYLIRAAEHSNGIRVLRQDLWETLVSFIISQRNNIPRIKTCINRIVERFGHFPTPPELQRGTLVGAGLGYRDEYLYDAAERFSPEMTDFRAIKGVGEKVENCVELFGLGKKAAFPRDVHILRIEQDHFNGRFPEERFEGFAGVLQQFLFYYNLYNIKLAKGKRV